MTRNGNSNPEVGEWINIRYSILSLFVMLGLKQAGPFSQPLLSDLSKLERMHCRFVQKFYIKICIPILDSSIANQFVLDVWLLSGLLLLQSDQTAKRLCVRFYSSRMAVVDWLYLHPPIEKWQNRKMVKTCESAVAVRPLSADKPTFVAGSISGEREIQIGVKLTKSVGWVW